MTFIAAFVCFLFPFTLSGATSYENEVPADAVITLQRGACERRCAVYKIVIFADGTVIYDGQYLVKRKGLILSQGDPAMLLKLIDDFKAINYFSLKNQYGYDGTNGCDSIIPDGPIVKTSIAVSGQAKAIIHQHRCAGAIPAQLSDLEDKIDRFAHSAQWIR